MRVMVLINSLYTGGAEFSTLSFYQWLRQQGHDVQWVCVKQATPAYDPLQFGFDQVHYLSPGSFLKKVKSCNQYIKQFNPHIVHSVLFEANLIARVSRMWLRNFVHVESLVNEIYSEYRYNDPRVTRWKLEGYRWLDKLTQRKGVDHFHANGQSVADHYRTKVGIDPKRITIIHRGRKPNPYVGDVANRKRLRQELNTGDRLVLIHVGRHEYQKGHDTLLEAISLLGAWKEKILVWLVGREGNFTAGILEKINTLKLNSSVMLAGHRSDISAWLAAADAFVFPSRFEGLPGVLIEAEAAGLPIICSDIKNNLEVVQENSNALVFGVNKAEELATQIKKLLQDKPLRDKMGAASQAIFQDRFQEQKIHQHMEEWLINLKK